MNDGSSSSDDPSAPGAADASDSAGDRSPRPSDRTALSRELPESVRCPFCDEDDSEQFAAFGSALSTSQYYCRSCRTVFEFMKWRARGRSPSRETEDSP